MDGSSAPPKLSPGLQQIKAQADAQRQALAQALLRESDRAVGVLGGELVSQRLCGLLRSYCRQDVAAVRRYVDPLFSGFGPLATFGARISIAYALGIISDRDRVRLDLVRRIRNEFAHNPAPINFGDPDLVGRLNSLVGDPTSSEDASEERKLIGDMLVTNRQFLDRVAFVVAIVEVATHLDACRVIIETGGDVRQYNAFVDAKELAEHRHGTGEAQSQGSDTTPSPVDASSGNG